MGRGRYWQAVNARNEGSGDDGSLLVYVYTV